VAEVGGAVGERRGHRHDGDVEHGEVGRVARGPVAAVGEDGGETLVGDVVGGGAAGGDARHLGGVEVEPDDDEPCLSRRHGDGQSDVPLANDHDPLGRVVVFLVVTHDAPRCGRPATSVDAGHRVIVQDASRAARSPPVAEGYSAAPMSTRRLIILSLLCGVAILVAFVVQLAIVR